MTQKPTKSTSDYDAKSSKIIRTVVIALILDIFSFTIILPLFPRLLDYYRENDSADENSLFSITLRQVETFKALIGGSGTKLDVVLFGGALGSLFSFLQFLVAPQIGKLSDKWGRKKVLMLSMIGNAVSCGLWIFARDFETFVLSRIIGGLCEGNVQLSVAIITDVTSRKNRSRGLALVGIAFALGFTFGPALGAYFASLDLLQYSPTLDSYGLNPYSAPALGAFFLIIIEMVYLYFFLDESINYKRMPSPTQPSFSSPSKSAKAPAASTSTTKKPAVSAFNQLSLLHFTYLFIFSGLEFTLPFLTYDRHNFTNREQGMLLGFIGLISAFIQGSYTRRYAHKLGEKTIVLQGLVCCMAGFMVIAIFNTVKGLYMGALFLSVTSATVVTGLTSLASLCIGEDEGGEGHGEGKDVSEGTHQNQNQGMLLGHFRSLGQLGRACGPLMTCALYWIYGALKTYSMGAFVMIFVAFWFSRIPTSQSGVKDVGKSKKQ
ncbi:MFS general substrate transporter [Paraphysoderma sedebokerense]|nr:MFS general substrate transporter [Paraphysoderma sedebokerense]